MSWCFYARSDRVLDLGSSVSQRCSALGYCSALDVAAILRCPYTCPVEYRLAAKYLQGGGLPEAQTLRVTNMINTVSANRERSLADYDSVWLFGYGSLIFKVDFPYTERKVASIVGWERRFWQGSHDHRGTPEKPGRVATLIEVDNAECLGMAYRVTPQTFAHLDYREKNGYLRFFTPVKFADQQSASAEALVYVAAPNNSAFLGAASIEQMAVQIASSHGPSGSNADYLFELDQALQNLGETDPHVNKLSRAVYALLAKTEPAAR